MQTLNIEGARLECEVKGAGDPLLLIHGSILPTMSSLLDEPALVGSFRVISYHRRGFVGSDRAVPPFSIAQQADDARAVLRQLGISRAHVAGHSYGGVTALQLTKDAPDSVASLALLEPALVGPPFWEEVAPARAMYDRGDRAAAMGGFLTIAMGPNYREIIDKTLPGVFEQALADVDTLFQVELGALERWSFTAEDARRIRQPVVSVVGEESPPMFREIHAQVRQWIPHADELRIPRANHGFPFMNPRALADGLARFLRGRRM